MMMSHLPADLVEEILSRVPATSLIRLRSTCKQWNTLFKDQRFTEKHLRNAPKQPRVLMLKDYRLLPTSVDLNFVPPSIEIEYAIDLKYYNSSEPVLIKQVFHCDGLLLCTTKEDELVVWNPCLGETRWIKQNDGSSCDFREYEFALGYENNQSSRSYKLLRLWGFYSTREENVNGEIYDFNSNAWRVVNAPHCFEVDSPGVNLKGISYWSSSDNKESLGYLLSFDYTRDYLLSFDYTRERFRRLCFPITDPECTYTALSVVREELSVLRWNWSSKMEMWVTNKIDTTCEADLSWTKSFEVDYGFDVYSSLLIDEDKKVALCCSSYIWKDTHVVRTVGEEDKYYTEITFEVKHPLELHIFNYVPSLVQIQQYISSDEVIRQDRTAVKPSQTMQQRD